MSFCGIGNPSAFFEDLRTWGFQVAEERSFSDHHQYTAREAMELERAASNCCAHALLCTGKDVCNLRNVQFTAVAAYCCRISFDLPEGFWSAVNEAARRGEA